ncbi:MAG: hypothetical protein ABSC05_15700 [Candidatus Solibacter sp.]
MPVLGHVCRGEGVAFNRELIGDPSATVRFPVVASFSRLYRLLGLPAHAPNFVVTFGLGCPEAIHLGVSPPRTSAANCPDTALEEISGIQICTATPSMLHVPKPDSSDVRQGWGSR